MAEDGKDCRFECHRISGLKPVWERNAQSQFLRFWIMMHEARTDFAMLLGSIFLLVIGGMLLV